MKIAQTFYNQKGAFAPFMFGMLLGVAIFSTIVSQWVKQEMKLTEADRIKTEKLRTEDVSSALEAAILSENQNVAGLEFSNNMSLERAKSFTSRGTLQTRSGEDYQVQSSEAGDFAGLKNKRVIISSSDNRNVKEEIERYISPDAMSYLEGNNDTAITMLDTQEIRMKQIKQTRENMNMLASQLYLFWGRSGNFKFPTTTEFEEIVKNLALRTVWGENFKYIRTDNDTARLEFSTPWGYKEGMDLKMEQ